MKRTLIATLTLALAPAMFAAPQPPTPKSTGKAPVVSPIPSTGTKGPADKGGKKGNGKGTKGSKSKATTTK